MAEASNNNQGELPAAQSLDSKEEDGQSQEEVVGPTMDHKVIPPTDNYEDSFLATELEATASQDDLVLVTPATSTDAETGAMEPSLSPASASSLTKGDMPPPAAVDDDEEEEKTEEIMDTPEKDSEKEKAETKVVDVKEELLNNHNNNVSAQTVTFATSQDTDDSAVTKSFHNHTSMPTLASATSGSSFSSGMTSSFQDHWSLGSPSTTLRFRSKDMRVLDDAHDSQLIIEQSSRKTSGPNSSTAKYVATGNFGMRLLRTIYTLVSLFVLSVFFAFGAQAVLFLFMNLVAGNNSATWTNPQTIGIFGALLAVPLLLYSMASLMTLSWAFSVDCWNGMGSNENSLLRRMVFWNGIVTEWVVFLIMGAVPLLTVTITTLMRKDNWWELTALAWASAVGFFQFFYMLLAIVNEVSLAAYVVQKYGPVEYVDPGQDGQHRSGLGNLLALIKANVLLTQRQKYSGLRHQRYLVHGKDVPPPNGFSADPKLQPTQTYLRPLSRFTLVGSKGCTSRGFALLSPPRRNYSMDEVFGNVAILNNHNWSMERLWCMDRNRGAAVTLREGPAAVTSFQIQSGHVCIAVSSVLIVLAVAGFLSWAGQGAAVIVVVLLVMFVLCILPMVMSSYRTFKFNHQKVSERKTYEEDESLDGDVEEAAMITSTTHQIDHPDSTKSKARPFRPGLPQGPSKRLSMMQLHAFEHQPVPIDQVIISVWESVRISEAQPWFCWTMMFFEVNGLYLWPLISLFASGNGPVATLFFFVGLFSLIRHYFNATNLLQTLGPVECLDLADMSPALCGLGGGSQQWWSSTLLFEQSRKLRNQALVAALSQRVTRSRATRNWVFLFGFLFFCVATGFLLAANEDEFDYKVKGVVFPQGFYYEPQPQLPYPTCQVQKGFSFPGQAASALADYAFLATMSFAGPGEAQVLLDNYFGPGVVLDDFEFVQGYRNATGTETHPVTYSLFTFPSNPNSAIVSIRGSESMWDWMADIQLWAGSVLAQIIRGINPFGWIWTNILDEVVYVINSVQSKKLKEVSYYQYTSQFVNDLYAGTYDGRQYENLRVTGASLGGGLSILTGALTGASAIAISGLNAMYSRRTFDPPITMEQLNTRVFNVIPARDIIARIDEPGDLIQRTQCRAPKNSLFACHSMWRTLCEIAYQCGSNGRPINCWCTSKYGYPYPQQNGTLTWEQACADAPYWTPSVSQSSGQ